MEKTLRPRKFYLGYAINIEKLVTESSKVYYLVALSEYEDDVLFEECTNGRVYLGSDFNDIMNDEFLGSDLLTSNNYCLFVLKDSLKEVTKDEFAFYLKNYFLAPHQENMRCQLAELTKTTVIWKKYFQEKQNEYNSKVKSKIASI